MFNENDLPLEDDLPLFDYPREERLTPDQLEGICHTLREEDGKGGSSEFYNLELYLSGCVEPLDTQTAFHRISECIRIALGFTEEEAKLKAPQIQCFIRQQFKDSKGWMSKKSLRFHSVMRKRPYSKSPLKFCEFGMGKDTSSLLFSFMNGQSRQAFAKVNRHYRSILVPKLHDIIQNAITNESLLYAVPFLQLDIRSTTLSALVKFTRKCLQANKIALFQTKQEACLYTQSRGQVLGVEENRKILFSPIITVAPLEYNRVPYQFLEVNLSAPVECAIVDPKDYVGLRVELYSRSNWSLGTRRTYAPDVEAFLKTPFDYSPPEEKIGNEPEKLHTTRFNRNLSHHNFMKSLPGFPYSPRDAMHWLEFYCDQYLPTKENSTSKREALKAALAEIKKAEEFGLDLGSNIKAFVKRKISGKITLYHLLQTKRIIDNGGYPWGWKTFDETFISPKMNPFNRNQRHQDIMKQLNTPPTLNDFCYWLLDFYLPYLLTHGRSVYPGSTNAFYEGRVKFREISDCLKLHRKAGIDQRLTIEEFLDIIPRGSRLSLKDVICNHSFSEGKITWGWKTIVESFIEPERAQNTLSTPVNPL